MKRTMIVLAIAGLLVACTDQGGAGSGRASRLIGRGAAESGGAASDPSAAATRHSPRSQRWRSVLCPTSATSRAEVEPTIQSCESVADWIAGAQQVVDDDINPNTVALLLKHQLRGSVVGQHADLRGACIVLIRRRVLSLRSARAR